MAWFRRKHLTKKDRETVAAREVVEEIRSASDRLDRAERNLALLEAQVRTVTREGRVHAA